ncbi:MAG TPA: hypothetical protein VM165_08540 [Planctomycetaceae bacterium]|nr:hypothetical protein [Planctomycetaceae bacterium]
MTPQETNDRIDEAFRDPRIIQAAIEQGIADAMREHARAGRVVPIWKDGKIVWVDPVTFAEVDKVKAPVSP